MSKKLDEDGVEWVDGEAVTLYDARFSNTFMMDAVDAAPIASGDVRTFLITARTCDPTFKHTKTGELKRLNPFKIEEAICMEENIMQALLDALAVTRADRTAEDYLGTSSAPVKTTTIEIFDEHALFQEADNESS